MSSNEIDVTPGNDNYFLMDDVEMSVITDKKKAIEAVKVNGYELKRVSENLQDDFEVVIAAVTETGGAIFDASPNMKNNLHVAVAAIKSMEESINSVSPELLRNHPGLYDLASICHDYERGKACDTYLQEHEKHLDRQRIKGWEISRSSSPQFFDPQSSSPEKTTPLSPSRCQH